MLLRAARGLSRLRHMRALQGGAGTGTPTAAPARRSLSSSTAAAPPPPWGDKPWWSHGAAHRAPGPWGGFPAPPAAAPSAPLAASAQQHRGMSKAGARLLERRRRLASKRQEAAAAVAPPGDALQTSAPSELTDQPPRPQGSLLGVLDNPALIITREIEWGTVLLGFEQANRYTIFDQTGAVCGYIAEETTGLASAVGRQLLHRRRSVTATVMDAAGAVVMRVRRPMYLINSGIYVEDAAGNVVGECQQRWHLLQRNYDLYYRKQQFAAIRGTFLTWEFTMQDDTGATMAVIDRNFSGFGKELFTDAGKYVIHFGERLGKGPGGLGMEEGRPVQEGDGGGGGEEGPGFQSSAFKTAPPTVAAPPAQQPNQLQAAPGSAVAEQQSSWGSAVQIVEPLTLSERAIALAAAITIDFDYFSQHSSGGGMFGMPMMMPIPMPGGGGGAEGAAGEAEAGGAAAGGGAGDAGGGGGGWGGWEEEPDPETGGSGGEADEGDSWWGGGDDGGDGGGDDGDFWGTIGDIFGGDD